MLVTSNLLILFLFVRILVAFTNKSITSTTEKQLNITQKTYDLAKYMVSLRIRDYTHVFGDNHRCVGVIIAPKIILTAAQCTYHPLQEQQLAAEDLHIVVGSPDRFDEATTRTIDVENYKIHSLYTEDRHKNDIVLLHLTSEIIEDDLTAQSITLTTEYPKEGTNCTVAGWGRLLKDGPLANEVRYDEVSIIHQKTCLQNFSLRYGNTIVCANNLNDLPNEKGVCFGDLGSPLICNGVLAGVASLRSVRGCSATGFADGYTNIWYYRDWIENSVISWKAKSLVIIIGLFLCLLYCYGWCND